MIRADQVSIIIATVERPVPVIDCVKSLAPFVPAEVEVIVVDASEKLPVDPAALLAVWPNSKYIRYPQKNASLQRNEGIRCARGEIVCFLDDDCYVQPGWWPQLLEPFDDPLIAGVAGGIWTSLKPTLINKPTLFISRTGMPVNSMNHTGSGATEVDWAQSGNMAFRKEVLTNIGGFDPDYVVYDEDTDLGLRVRAQGWKIVFLPNASVYHYGHLISRPRPSKWHAFRLGRNRGMLIGKNYGFSGRLFLLLLVTPLRQVWEALCGIGRSIWQNCGHALFYCSGVLSGALKGLKKRCQERRRKL